MQSGYVEILQIQQEKGFPFISVPSLKLIEGKGIAGDCHASGGEKQITLISLKAKQWISNQALQGLCFNNFQGNIVTSKIDYAKIKQGDILTTNSVKIEITSHSKQCYSECIRLRYNLSCILTTGIVFAKVTQSGSIHVGDRICLSDVCHDME